MGIMDYFYRGVDLENVPEGDGRGGRNNARQSKSPRDERNGGYDSYGREDRRNDDEQYVAATRSYYRDEPPHADKPAPQAPVYQRAPEPGYTEKPMQPPLSYAKRPTSLSEVLVYSPQGYEDVQGLIDYLKSGTPIIVDLNAVRDNAAQRILDFLSGAIYAVDGAVLKLQSSMFLLTPGGVNIAT